MKLRDLEPMLCNKRSHCTLQLKNSPQLLQLEKVHAQQRRPSTAINKCVCVLSHFSCVRLFATLWTVASQTPLSMGFSRQEYWSESPCPPPGHLPSSRMEPVSLVSSALAGGFFTTRASWEAHGNNSTSHLLCARGRAQYATGGEWRNSSRKNEEAEPK